MRLGGEVGHLGDRAGCAGEGATLARPPLARHLAGVGTWLGFECSHALRHAVRQDELLT